MSFKSMTRKDVLNIENYLRLVSCKPGLQKENAILGVRHDLNSHVMLTNARSCKSDNAKTAIKIETAKQIGREMEE
jgi:hypothetical protein